jgi:hypothetical protein
MTAIARRSLQPARTVTSAGSAASIRIRVSHYAAPLIEFILNEADLEWRDLVREEVDATVVIDTNIEQLDDTIRMLRQRLGGNLTELVGVGERGPIDLISGTALDARDS